MEFRRVLFRSFVFFVLMIINLIVITKGAGRVSEVSARFTLDALPGKQMAIDADLNAGLLTPEEAKARRVEVGTEADFYGSMDGASNLDRKSTRLNSSNQWAPRMPSSA